jgi:hypothetical protein
MTRRVPIDGVIYSAYGDYLHKRGRTDGYRHAGVDIHPVRNEAIRSPVSGIVTRAEPHKSYGPYMLEIKGPYFWHVLGHCSAVIRNVGDSVKVGDIVAWPGKSHLHWEVRTKKTRQKNPWQNTIDPIGYLENKQISYYHVGKQGIRRKNYPFYVGEKTMDMKSQPGTAEYWDEWHAKTAAAMARGRGRTNKVARDSAKIKPKDIDSDIWPLETSDLLMGVAATLGVIFLVKKIF